MAYTQAQLNQMVQQAQAKGIDPGRIQNALRNTIAKQGLQQPQQPHSRSLIGQLAPLLGSVVGGVAGSFALPGVGTAAGGAAGGALGEALAQKLSGEKTNATNILREGAFGGLGGAGEAFQALRGAGTVARGAEAAVDAGRAARGIGLAEKGVTALGRGVENAGESLATKALRARPSQLAGFAAKHGEDIVPLLQRENLIGKSAEDIAAHIEPIQQKFNSMIASAKAKVNPANVKQAFLDHMKPLLESTDPQDAQIAKKIEANLNNIVKSVEKDPSVANLNKIRQQYDAKVNYKLAAQDIASYGEKKTIADALRSSVQAAVDQAGLKGPKGESLKELGSRLNKLYDVSKIAESQSHLGRGSLPAGLLQLLSIGGGGAVLGGPAGSIAGLVAQQAINSPTGMRLSSQALTKAGSAISNLAPKIGPTIGRAVNIGAAQQGANALFGNGQPQEQPIQDLGLPMQQMQQQPQQQVDNSDAQRQYFLQAMMDDLNRTGGKNIAKIQAVAQFSMQAQKPLNTTAASQVSQFDNSLANLDEVESLVNQLGGSFGPIKGRLNSLNPYSETQANINQATLIAAQNIGRALEGGKLTDADIARYQKALPNINDTPQVAQDKINRLRKLIMQQRQNYVQNVSGSQQDPTSLLISGLNSSLSGY